MRAVISSFVERAIPRAASALVVLALAAYLGPPELGLYAGAMIAMTLVQSVTDGVIRQLAVPAITTPEGCRFLSRYVQWVAVLGGLAVLIGLTAAWLTSETSPISDGLALIGLVAVPGIVAARAMPLARLQSHGAWGILARRQGAAAGAALAVSLAVLALTKSLAAATVQAVLAEGIFTLLVWQAGRAAWVSEVESSHSELWNPSVLRRQFRSLSAYAGLAWAQSQLDRVLLLAIAGTDRLGSFALSWSISRAGADALAGSSSNVARPALLHRNDVGAFRRVIRRALVTQLVVYAITVVGALAVVGPIVGDQWAEAVHAVPVLALTGFASVVEWTATIAMIARRRIHWAAPVKVMGLLLALPIAMVAARSIESASWLVVLREITVMLGMTLASRGLIWREAAASVAITGCLGALVLLWV